MFSAQELNPGHGCESLESYLLGPQGTPEVGHFKVNRSVTLGTFTVLCNQHCYLVPEHFSSPPTKGNPHPR